MDWDMVAGNWSQFLDKVKGRWAKISHDRLHAIAGDRGKLVLVVKETYGITEEMAEQQVQDFELRNKEYRPWTSSCSKWRAV
jgi:uncharacterized protein YjbJ (UPF0337 family)